MREIKFRVWDKKEKKFKIKNEEVCFGDVAEFLTAVIDFEENSIQINGVNKYKFLQYTGLKDMNDKEIYEGDIVKYKYPYDKRFKHISLVKYLESEASFGIKDLYKNDIPLYEITADNYLEVIGNIYENYNLLGDDNNE